MTVQLTKLYKLYNEKTRKWLLPEMSYPEAHQVFVSGELNCSFEVDCDRLVLQLQVLCGQHVVQ